MNRQSEPGHSPFYKPTLGALTFVALLVIVSYTGLQLHSIEVKIDDRFAPGLSDVTTDVDTQPVYTTRHAHTIYLPVYSHAYSIGATRVQLGSTLSIRNTDPDSSIVISALNYYDSKGRLIDEYLDGHLELGPRQSTEIRVKEPDNDAGAGAHFIVKWSADESVHLPLVQAVMVGGAGEAPLTLLSTGQPLTTRIDPPKHTPDNKDVKHSR